MSSKYLTLEEAATSLGLTPAELIRAKDRGKIRGFQDGKSWKFKSESVEDYRRQMQEDSGDNLTLRIPPGGLDSGSALDGDDDADVLDSPTLVRGSSSDSDVRLIFDDSPLTVPGKDSDSDVTLAGGGSKISKAPKGIEDDDDASVSDVTLSYSYSGRKGSDYDGEESVSDVRLLPSDSDSDVKLVGAPSKGSDSDVKLVGGVDLGVMSDDESVFEEPRGPVSSDSGVSLDRPNDSGVSLERRKPDSGVSIELKPDSGVSLASVDASSDSGISLDVTMAGGLSDSGISLDVSQTLSSDSGISLDVTEDSGISLEDSLMPGSGTKKRGSDVKKGGRSSKIKKGDKSATAPMMDIPFVADGGSDALLDTNQEMPLLDDDSSFDKTASVVSFDDDDGSSSDLVADSATDAPSDDLLASFDDDEEAGSSGSVEIADDILGEDDELDEEADEVFGADDDDFEDDFESGASHAEIVIPGAVQAPRERSWGTGAIVGLGLGMFIATAASLSTVELMRGLFEANEVNPLSAIVLGVFRGFFG